MASAFTLFGLSFHLRPNGNDRARGIAQRLAGAPLQPLLAAGTIMTLIGFAFKIAAAPFHLWAPDAYQGAPVSAPLSSPRARKSLRSLCSEKSS